MLAGNPIGGLVFTSAFGNGDQQVHEWTSFMSTYVCSRLCTRWSLPSCRERVSSWDAQLTRSTFLGFCPLLHYVSNYFCFRACTGDQAAEYCQVSRLPFALSVG